jgi:hypothetical protein
MPRHGNPRLVDECIQRIAPFKIIGGAGIHSVMV